MDTSVYPIGHHFRWGLTRFDGLLVEFRTAVLIFSYDTNDNVWWCKSCILSWHGRNKILLLPNWKFYPVYHIWIQSGYLPKLESQLAHSTFTHVPYPVKETGKIRESFYRKNSFSYRLFQTQILKPIMILWKTKRLTFSCLAQQAIS